MRLVPDRLGEDDQVSEYQGIKDIAPKLGIGAETLRRWCRDAEARTGGVSASESDELRRVNELLKAASAFFASELDRPGTK